MNHFGKYRTKNPEHKNKRNVVPNVLPAWRTKFVLLMLLVAMCALIGRAFYLQLINDAFLQEKGESRYQREIVIPASRGRIFDRHGDILAGSTPMPTIVAIPALLKQDSKEKKEALAKALSISFSELEKRINVDKTFVYLQRQVKPEVGLSIAQLKLKGIRQETEYKRFYPAAEMTAHLVGFTDIADKGQEGVELALQSLLMGEPGERLVIKDRRGNIVEDLKTQKLPRDGTDVHLALDSKIQYIAHTQLKQAIAANQAKAGGVIVLDTNTGEILALANSPGFNPNARQAYDASFRNRAVTDTFEPGSTLKPFIAALALELGKVKPTSTINCAPGKLTIGPATISDAHPHGVLSVAQVIQKSSNVGAAKLAAMTTYQQMYDMFQQVGFGKSPKLGFPGEVAGMLRNWKHWRPIEQATMSYGHGISISLIQLARSYLPLARDGDIIPLSLLRQENDLPPSTPVFSAQTARDVRAMLEMVVSPEGTAPKARVPGYRAGGKTGTAYKLENGEYVKKYVASFVGMAPMSSPRFIVAVMLDEPSGGAHYGGDVAGPAFSAIMGGVLRSSRIPPDDKT